MTNALAQNIQNDKNASIDLLARALSVSSSSENQNQGTGFSNIINNLDSRTQKAQNNAQKEVIVSNTSSINKKALNKKETINPTSNEKHISKEDLNQNDINKNTIKTTPEKKDNNAVSKNETMQVETTEKPISEEETQDLSDINNSSLVETSPVFSSDKEVTLNEEEKVEIEDALAEIEINVQELISTLAVADGTSTIENQDLKTKIEDLIENFESFDETIKTIEEISSSLDNSSLNQNQKDLILSTLEETKKLLQDIQKTLETPDNFDETLNEVKNNIQNILKDTINKIDENLNNSTIQNATKEIKETINSKEIEKVVEVVENLSKDVQKAIDSNNDDKLTKVESNLKETIKEVENLLENNQIDTDLKEKLVNSLKNLQKLIEPKEESSIIQADFSSKETVFETLDELKTIDLKEVDTTDKKTMDEIIKVLDNLDKNLNDFEIDKDIQNEIKTKIENLATAIENKEISTDEIEQAIDTIADDIKVEIQKQENEILIKDNTIDISTQFEKFNNNQNSKNDTKQEFNFEQKEIQEPDLTEVQDVDFETPEINLKGKVDKNIDVNELEENLQKQIFTQEILDEMMVEVDIQTISSQSGTLSVADEVARLAMSETTLLNPVTSAHGSVTYDSIGISAVIKNAASLMKAPAQTPTDTPLMEDVLNQVANKITQLKDGATQKLTMVLRPLDLGRLSIELTTNQNGLTTHIVAQNENVRNYIEKNIDSLRQQLSDAGVNVNNIQIKTAGSEGSTTNYDGNQNLNKENQENLNQEQNNKNNQNQNHNHNQNNKEAKDFIASINNYDMHFAKDFSSVLNKSLNYNLN